MEKDRKWEEAALEEEEEIGALEVRQRRRDVNARENENDSSEEKKEVVEAGLEGEQRSVYYDKEQGVWKCRHCTWTYQLNGPSRHHIQNHEVYCQVVMDIEPLIQLKSLFDSPIKGVEITPEAALMKLDNEDQFAAEKDATNGKVYFRTKKFHGQEDIPVQEANNILKNTKVENGSNSQHYSEGYSENEITRSQHEIDGDKEIKIVKKSEIKVSDVDLERVLEEQDTHDLFCPNCNSCITRRVILRKRKRSERSAEETESDASEKKTHKVPHDVDSSLVTAEKTDLDDREPDVFRCLSCFSFFIPTEGGFNIFRIFEKREENQNLQSSQQVPAKNINWISSIFKSGTSKRTESELGSTLPEESHTSSSRQMEDPSQRYKQSTVAQPVVEVTLHDQFQMNNEEKLSDTILNNYRGLLLHPRRHNCDLKLGDDIIQVPEIGSTLSDESIHGPLVPAVVVPPHAEIQIPESEQSVREAQGKNDWDVLKSIVYGGLIESVTSLSVVSSAAGTDASTLKIVALGLANLAGGFFVIVHDLFELRNAQDEATDQKGEPAGRYWEVLGRRANFKLHATIAILSYLLVGIMPPLIYGFSFRESNNTEYKLIAVAAAGLLCISLLAIGKAHVKPQKAYIKYLLSYLSLGVSASGLSYVAGLMISRLLEKLGLFDSNASVSAPPSIIHRDISSTVPAWASY
ncbi:membrane protein of ER body-like protein isoform X2 [Elaeis guineensis]|uniref:membrane protein of ER body-like protein isoform X2 n=1 Tax=Elaeis guineensis var. tenera TaxID=51953 RepID=UPI003C6D2EE0